MAEVPPAGLEPAPPGLKGPNASLTLEGHVCSFECCYLPVLTRFHEHCGKRSSRNPCRSTSYFRDSAKVPPWFTFQFLRSAEVSIPMRKHQSLSRRSREPSRLTLQMAESIRVELKVM